MTYTAPVREIAFCLDHVVGAGRLARTDRYADATDDARDAILTEAARLCEQVLAPLNIVSDRQGAVLENGVVRTTPGFREAYKAIAEGGWVGISADPEFGGMGLPMTFTTAVNEMMSSACLSLGLCPLLSQGQIEALENHASDEIKALYLPRLISGEWTGTMNLTEPSAGSDVGALRSRAEPDGQGTWRVTGQKIFISWGDHDVAENVVHLVLARLPGAPSGTKGISLFLVPKFIPDENGAPGQANSLRVVSLEHKMGLHGSPTAVMEFDGARGWMIGPENGGMACMFTMMNNARLGVGVQGLGVAEAAYQKALAYARERRQGRTPIGDGNGAIVDHADVRRMLLRMKTLTEAARAICLDTAFSTDMARALSGDEAAAWKARAAFLTPIAKAFGTDVGNEVAYEGVQVHGGMGYIEETGAAQFSRDVRVTAIYEGTNGIQAMDLTGRKMMDGGAAARALLAELRAVDEPSGRLGRAVDALARATDWMLDNQPNDRFAGAVPYLRMWGLTLGAAALVKGAAAASGDDARRRAALADWFLRAELSAVPGLAEAACTGAAPLYALSADDLAA
ncbi:acyl-CoA dehydrogenase [Oceanicella actignis]|uniref:acyl-CoA dehydrogenase n=1 Tax=Oceanicella actignis TaxID=1189325 RepID=UPI0011E6EA36|nr:acyl-CoA dehydrogenase [Oceanicella actignis]TYO90755.1 hypothetical protein LY05_00886 [Oceanicella actignis]